MSVAIEPWGASAFPEPEEYAEVEVCDDPECPACIVTRAGAQMIAAATGIDFDAEDDHAQAQMMHLASHVYSAMSEAILALPGIKSLGTATITPEGVIPE